MTRNKKPEYTAMREYSNSFIDLGDCVVQLLNSCYGSTDCELELRVIKGGRTPNIKIKSHINCGTAKIKVNNHPIVIDLITGQMRGNIVNR